MIPPNITRDTPDGCTLSIRIHPAARRNAITGTHGETLKISLTSPPVDGRANEALIHFLSGLLQLPRSNINLLTGATSRTKVLRIKGRSAAEVQATLLPIEPC